MLAVVLTKWGDKNKRWINDVVFCLRSSTIIWPFWLYKISIQAKSWVFLSDAFMLFRECEIFWLIMSPFNISYTLQIWLNLAKLGHVTYDPVLPAWVSERVTKSFFRLTPTNLWLKLIEYHSLRQVKLKYVWTTVETDVNIGVHIIVNKQKCGPMAFAAPGLLSSGCSSQMVP